MEISFYHLTSLPIEKALPKLLEKITQQGEKVMLWIKNPDNINFYDTIIWTFASLAFIPHGTKKDPNPELQHVYITDDINDNANNATIIITPEENIYEEGSGFKKYLYMFNGQDEEKLNNARKIWKKYSERGDNLIYWKQDSDGKWNKNEK